MKTTTTSGFIALLTLISFNTFSQSTYSEVYNIFQANCTVGCHNSTTQSGNLDFTLSSSALYSRIVDGAPTNPAALAKGHKLIAPGYPDRSFLLRKCNKGWDTFYGLDVAEGMAMPNNPTSLNPKDLELLRQWIMYGAPQTGTPVAISTINNFYNGLGKTRLARPAVPAASEGFQMRIGPFLRNPATEIEYRLKQQLNFPDTVEITRIECFMNSESHHFILDKFLPGTSQSVDEGLRPVSVATGTNTTMVDAWQSNRDSKLPEGTAYFWEPTTVLDMNYHILNYSQDLILAAETYLNIYTQPKGTAQAQMFSELVVYPPPLLFILPGQSATFTRSNFLSGSNDTMYIHLLSSHTHKYGVDYDIYKRNPNDSRGDQVYEGFYNRDYTFNQGYYDWAHPAVRIFDPQEAVAARDGLIHEAKFNNTGSTLITFGLTTDDEMMLYTIQYSWKRPENVGIDNKQPNAFDFEIYPNPTEENTVLSYSLKESSNVALEIFNIHGVKVETLTNTRQTSGKYNHQLFNNQNHVGKGIYIARLTVNGNVFSKKIVKLN